MSGHSKWATIHRQKEVKDAKKGQAFTKLAAAITVAVREGGGVADPNENFKLRLVTDKARQFNMPKDSIRRAIDRAAGGGGTELAEVEFEGFLPGGAAVVVSGLTDNKLRTAQTVRGVLEKSGGTLAGQGAVSYLFLQKGEIVVKPQAPNPKSQDELELELIDLGAEEIEREGDNWLVYCERDKTFEVKGRLTGAGYEVESVELVMKPIATVTLGGAVAERSMEILEKLAELEDIHKVYTNAGFAG